MRIAAEVWWLDKFRFYLYGKKIPLYTDHQALEPFFQRNRSNKQYSARLTRWLDRLTNIDISIQHIAGSNFKFTVYLSRNPARGPMPEATYDEEYVINILAEQAELNLKYGQLFADKWERSKPLLLERRVIPKAKVSKKDQSEPDWTFENENHVNAIGQSETTPSGQSVISTLEDSQPSKDNDHE